MGKETVEYRVKRAWRVVFKYPNGSLQVFCRSLGRFDICELADGIWKPSGKTVSANDLAVAWFFAMFACGLWLTGDCSALGWVVFAMFGPGLFALIYAPLDLILTYAIAYWLDV